MFCLTKFGLASAFTEVSVSGRFGRYRASCLSGQYFKAPRFVHAAKSEQEPQNPPKADLSFIGHSSVRDRLTTLFKRNNKADIMRFVLMSFETGADVKFEIPDQCNNQIPRRIFLSV